VTSEWSLHSVGIARSCGAVLSLPDIYHYRASEAETQRPFQPTSRAGEYVISVALAAVGGTKCILVLASDGLWSHLSAIQVMAIVAEELIGVQEGALARPLPRPRRASPLHLPLPSASPVPPNCSRIRSLRPRRAARRFKNAAKSLVTTAYKRGSRDDISVVVLELG
jgi:serine/threonine protein phosphatase PrpC